MSVATVNVSVATVGLPISGSDNETEWEVKLVYLESGVSRGFEESPVSTIVIGRDTEYTHQKRQRPGVETTGPLAITSGDAVSAHN